MSHRRPIAVLLACTLALTQTACDDAERRLAAEPRASYAHGTFYWERGITAPDAEYLLTIQRHFIRKFEGRLATQAEQRKPVKKLIYSTITDKLLANGLYLDWLIQQADPAAELADITTANTARLYYLRQIRRQPVDATGDGYWTKGIDVDAMRVLQRQGLNLFDRAPTANSTYVEACAAAGVPVPRRLFDSQWQSAGVIDKLLFGTAKPHNELSLYVSDDPPGYCVALTRSNGPTAVKGHIDLICVGQQSSKACFFETLGFNNNVDGVIDISELLAAVDLPLNNPNAGAAPCTRCHLGENPLIVHPQDPAFANALIVKAASMGGASTWNADNYYEPFSVPNWPTNPPPLALELIPSERQCSGCHVHAYAGRFPDVSGMPDPSRYNEYCDIIMTRVLAGNGNAFAPSMPMNDIANTAAYAAHKSYLLTMCSKPDKGVLVDNTFDDDTSYLSPPRVVAVYGCAVSVYVEDFIDGATVELLVNGGAVGAAPAARLPDSIEFSLPAPLQVGDVVQARQTVDGTSSELSRPFETLDYSDHFPDGLPAPTIDPSTVYACSGVVAVRYDIAGFKVVVNVNGADPVTGTTYAGHQSVVPGKTPFEIDDVFTAKVTACDEDSPVSEGAKAQRPASTTLTDAQINPTFFYEGQKLINVVDLTHGSSADIVTSGGALFGSFSTPLAWKIAQLEQPLGPSDQLAVAQRLCAFSSQPPFAQSPPVLPCSDLPAPEIRDPLPGDDYVSVMQPLIGARVRIHDDSGKELGDGTGLTVPLNRQLQDGESINATQQLHECVSSSAFRIEV
jgi:hypothetical protein